MTSINLKELTTYDDVAEAIARLDDEVARYGVIGVGELHEKGAGLGPRSTSHGIADPVLAPLWEHTAEMGLPLLIHVGEPEWAFTTPSRTSPHLKRFGRSPWSHRFAGGHTSNALAYERLRTVLDRNPELVVVSAHMHNVGRNFEQLDSWFRRHPNFHVELGLRHLELGWKPRAATGLLGMWDSRVLFGSDRACSVDVYNEIFRVLTSADEHFSPVAESRAEPWALYGLNLDSDILERVLRTNAQRVYQL